MNLRTLYLPHRLAEVFWQEDEHHPLVAAVQQLLCQRQLYKEEQHGVYDAATRSAIMAFQELEGLKTTGRVDPLTYCKLQTARLRQIESKPRIQRIKNKVARANILIARGNRTLTVFNGNTPIRQFPVALGKHSTPTPVGNFAIASKISNPGGVLGTRWMGLNYDSYGIHGTNRPWLIGQLVSNGCIRMHNHNAEELFLLINLGCPVYIRD